MNESVPRRKVWVHPRLMIEHAFDKLRLLDWIRPLHVVVIVDDLRAEERIVTVYEPDPRAWSTDYRRRG